MSSQWGPLHEFAHELIRKQIDNWTTKQCRYVAIALQQKMLAKVANPLPTKGGKGFPPYEKNYLEIYRSA